MLISIEMAGATSGVIQDKSWQELRRTPAFANALQLPKSLSTNAFAQTTRNTNCINLGV
jgi:hypothetical protein